jgi:hypothetical protein
MHRLVCVLLLAASASAFAEKPKLVTLGLLVPKTFDPSAAGAMNDAIAAEVAKKGFFESISTRDVETLLGLERQKQLLGCGDQASSCLAELSGALGARFVLSGTLGQLGDSWQLSLQMTDTEKSSVAARSTRIAKDVTTLRLLLPWMVAEATNTPVPPQPSKTWPTVLLATGGVFIIGGGLSGVSAFNLEAALKHELDRGKTVPGLLGPVSDYATDEANIKAQKNGALLGFGLGVALAIWGYTLWPPDPMQKIAWHIVPLGQGAALAGTF